MQKPKDYPFNEWSWQNSQKLKKDLKKQSPYSREQKIAQAQKIRQQAEEV